MIGVRMIKESKINIDAHALVLLDLNMVEASKEERDIINQKINDFNIAQTKCNNHEIEMSYVIKSEGCVIAGIESWLYFDEVLYISVIFVEEEYRHQRLGSYLLSKVEHEAKSRGAKLIHLDTFDFQAREFYLKHGYELFGILDDCPPGHQRYYLKKIIL